MTSWSASNERSRTIQRWLDEKEYRTTAGSALDRVWIVVAEDFEGVPLAVAQYTRMRNCLVIKSGIELSEHLQDKFLQLAADDRRAVIDWMGTRTCQYRVSFDVTGDPLKVASVSRVVTHSELDEEEDKAKDTFFTNLSHVRRAVYNLRDILVQCLYGKAWDDPSIFAYNVN